MCSHPKGATRAMHPGRRADHGRRQVHQVDAVLQCLIAGEDDDARPRNAWVCSSPAFASFHRGSATAEAAALAAAPPVRPDDEATT